MTSTRVTAGSLAALALAALVFVTLPGLDIKAAALFSLGGDRFLAQTPLGDVLRKACTALTWAAFLVPAAAWALRRLGLHRGWAPSGAGVAFMALSLALGPGLLVNAVLKDHSHRPRPYQVDLFGGVEAFRPFWRFDGACQRNCSFVSGEGSSAFWTLAPALLAPPPWRPAAIAAALVFGAATGLLRMAFGGHFLSDTVFAGLFTWLVILGCWRLVARIAGAPPRPALP